MITELFVFTEQNPQSSYLPCILMDSSISQKAITILKMHLGLDAESLVEKNKQQINLPPFNCMNEVVTFNYEFDLDYDFQEPTCRISKIRLSEDSQNRKLFMFMPIRYDFSDLRAAESSPIFRRVNPGFVSRYGKNLPFVNVSFLFDLRAEQVGKTFMWIDIGGAIHANGQCFYAEGSLFSAASQKRPSSGPASGRVDGDGAGFGPVLHKQKMGKR